MPQDDKKPSQKKTVSVSIDRELLDWIETQIKSKRFAHRSHAIEYALERLRKESKS